ncbi:hypothetical protein [Actinopolymorpha sp. B9G3]|uniref:hypothetical protein n=1 Tax=Actinopolymorpha sp. B9G3 TaxID=3158970 RepID=UPI0032D91901
MASAHAARHARRRAVGRWRSWVGVVLSDYDDLQEFGEIVDQEQRAITGGQPNDAPGGG